MNYEEIKLGEKYLVFDNRLYINDRETPNSVTFKPAIIVAKYKYTSVHGYTNDVVDVMFDHRPEPISKHHFIWAIKPL